MTRNDSNIFTRRDLGIVTRHVPAAVALLLVLATGVVPAGAALAIDWFTIDCGGAMSSSGGAFSVSGTIGQIDASGSDALSGGAFSLTGGFWPVASDPCAGFTVADCDCDGDVDSFDISAFVLALTSESGYNAQYPACNRDCVADCDLDGDIDSFDINAFVQCLTGGCP